MPTERYPATSATMDPALSERLLWELAPVYCRDTLTAPTGGCKAGDVIADSSVYGMALSDAAAGSPVACVVRMAVFSGARGDIDSTAKAALEAAGIVIRDYVEPEGSGDDGD